MLGSKVHTQLRLALTLVFALAPPLVSPLVVTGFANVLPAANAETRPQAQQKVAAPSTPRLPGTEELAKTVQSLKNWAKGRGGQLSAEIVDTQTGAVWAEANPQAALNPASNMKLLTVAVALSVLGGEYRFSTGLYGRLRNGKVETLVLRGEGDPSLDLAALWRLAHALERLGVREVGDILVDQSRFDDQFVPPAFGQQPDEWARFRAPVSAVALDQNTVTLNVVASEPGQPARVWFEPAGIVMTVGSITTRKPGKGQSIQLSLQDNPKDPTATPIVDSEQPQPLQPLASELLLAKVGGHVAQGMPRLRFARRLSDPRKAPGLALRRLLSKEGIKVTGKVALGGADQTHRLVFHRSEPLARLVHPLGKRSDNFYAEMLLKTLGAKSGARRASSADGAKVVKRWLDELGALAVDTKVVNGSGLFDGNHISARTLTQVLSAVARDTRISPEFMAQLSIGGVDGTLRSRLRKLRGNRQIRAKTGTLNSAVSLSGYVLSRHGQPPVAFSLMVNGISGQAYTIRKRFDQIVMALVRTDNKIRAGSPETLKAAAPAPQD